MYAVYFRTECLANRTPTLIKTISNGCFIFRMMQSCLKIKQEKVETIFLFERCNIEVKKMRALGPVTNRIRSISSILNKFFK